MQAVTQVKLLKASGRFSMVEIRLLTGRTHQIRVHLAHAGHPVLGDDKYGDYDLNHRLEKQGLRRLLLHASRLKFSHPGSAETLRLASPLPADFKAFVDGNLA